LPPAAEWQNQLRNDVQIIDDIRSMLANMQGEIAFDCTAQWLGSGSFD
jgi:hypothetical protein